MKAILYNLYQNFKIKQLNYPHKIFLNNPQYNYLKINHKNNLNNKLNQFNQHNLYNQHNH